jgi:steroid delta-isomerase-like uncharacterized protein
MSAEAKKAIVRRYQEALNANNLEALDEIVAPDLQTPDMLPGFPAGLEGAKRIHEATLAAWPDFHVAIEDLIAEGDLVAARITMTGTAVRPAFGLPGSGNKFRVPGMYMVRIVDGKIVEHWGLEDAISLMQQITGEANP